MSIIRRAKHSFSFESIDNKFPYEIQESGLVKKMSVFNYSPTYFRKKQANSEGLYRVDGGNIPDDLKGQITVTPIDLSNGKNPPPPIICNLNGGSAKKSNAIKLHNLSPNDIQDFPVICDEDNTDPVEINYEKGGNHKPNFMYMPTHQCSCSDNPRAEGYANEDNYNCLRYTKFGAGDVDSRCCQFFCGCFANGLIAFEYQELPNPDFTGTPGQAQYDDNGNFIPEKFTTFSPICQHELSTGFCCDKSWTDAYMDDDIKILFDSRIQEECQGNICNFGWYYLTTGTKYNLCVCPGLGKDENGDDDPNFKFESSVQEKLDALKNATGIEYKASDFYPYSSAFTRTYEASGNTNCGCSGKGGSVVMAGSKDCKSCSYVLPITMMPINGYNGGIITVPTKKCTSKSGDPKTICGCVFTDEVDFGECGKIYITTMTFPSYIFPNGSILEIGDNGAVIARGCGDEFVYSCNDIS